MSLPDHIRIKIFFLENFLTKIEKRFLGKTLTMFTSRSWSNRWHLDDAHLDHNCRICAEEFGESTWSVADHTARGSTMNRRFESGSRWKKTRVGLFEKMGEDRRAFGLSQAIIRVIILDDHFKGSFQVITSDVYSEIDEKRWSGRTLWSPMITKVGNGLGQAISWSMNSDWFGRNYKIT